MVRFVVQSLQEFHILDLKCTNVYFLIKNVFILLKEFKLI